MVDEVTINDAPDMSVDQAAHEEKMIAVADSGKVADEPSADAIPEKPENVPEKFWDAKTGVVNTEALLKSYTELEKGKPTVDDSSDDSEETDDAEGGDNDLGIPEQSGDTLMDTLAEGWAENGELTDAQYKQVEEQWGFNKAFVDNYIEGQVARIEGIREAAFETVGGEENYNAQVNWAVTNLSKAEQAALNKNLNSDSPEAVKQGVAALNKYYTDANGTPADLLNGGQGGDGSSYQSWAEVTKDMAHPDYKKDPAFQKRVADKLAMSKL